MRAEPNATPEEIAALSMNWEGLSRNNYSGVLSESSGFEPVTNSVQDPNAVPVASGNEIVLKSVRPFLDTATNSVALNTNYAVAIDPTGYDLSTKAGTEAFLRDVGQRVYEQKPDWFEAQKVNFPNKSDAEIFRTAGSSLMFENLTPEQYANMSPEAKQGFDESVYTHTIGSTPVAQGFFEGMRDVAIPDGLRPFEISMAFTDHRINSMKQAAGGWDNPSSLGLVSQAGQAEAVRSFGIFKNNEEYAAANPPGSGTSITGLATDMMGVNGGAVGRILDKIGIGGDLGKIIRQTTEELAEHPVQAMITLGTLGWGIEAAAAVPPPAMDVGAGAAAEGGLSTAGANAATDPLASGLSEGVAIDTAISGTGTGFETASLANLGTGVATDNILAGTVFDAAAVEAALTGAGATGAASGIAGGFIDPSNAVVTNTLAPELTAQNVLLEPGLGSLAGGGISLGASPVITDIATNGAGLGAALGNTAGSAIPPTVPITDQVAAATGGATADTVTGSVVGDVVAGGSVLDAINNSTVDDIANNGAGVNNILGGGDSGGLFSGDFWGDFWGSSEDGTGLAGIIGGITGAQNDSLANVLGQLIGGNIDQNNIEQQEQLIRDLYGQAIDVSDPFGQYRDQYATRLNNLYEDPSSIADLPNYKFMMDQGTQAINRSAAAKGGRLSGNVLYELQEYGQDLASQVRNDELSNLITLSGANVNPGNAAQPLMGMANQLTGLNNQGLAAWGNRLNNIVG